MSQRRIGCAAVNNADGSVDIHGSVASLGNNLIGNTTGATGFVATDLQNTNPNLGAPGSNGGPTPTLLPNSGSPAITAGNASAAAPSDQRGFARVVGGKIDIGAVQTQSPNVAVSSTTLTASLAAPVFGQPLTFTATVAPLLPASTSAVPAGGVIFTVDSQDQPAVTLTSSGQASLAFVGGLPAAAHTVSARYTPALNNNFAASASAPLTLTVQTAATYVSFASLPLQYNTPSTVSVTVFAVTATPTGTVAVQFDGNPAINQTLSNGSSIFAIPPLSTGKHSISVNYPAQGNFASSQVFGTLIVNPAGTNIAVTSTTQVLFGQPVTLVVNVTSPAGVPTGSVGFTMGSTFLGSAALNNGSTMVTIQLPPTASVGIVAAYQGDNNFLPTSATFLATTTPSASQGFVAELYLDLLGRQADPIGLASWTGLLNESLLTRTQVAFSIESSQEYRTDEVQALYQQYLHRPADQQGLAGFTNFLLNGGTVEQVAAALAGSPEFYKNQGGSTTAGFLNALYLAALNRPIDSSGLQTFTAALATMSRQQVAALVLSSPEYLTDLVQGFYLKFLRRSGSPTELSGWVSQLQTGLTDEMVIAEIVGSVEYSTLATT